MLAALSLKKLDLPQNTGAGNRRPGYHPADDSAAILMIGLGLQWQMFAIVGVVVVLLVVAGGGRQWNVRQDWKYPGAFGSGLPDAPFHHRPLLPVPKTASISKSCSGVRDRHANETQGHRHRFDRTPQRHLPFMLWLSIPQRRLARRSGSRVGHRIAADDAVGRTDPARVVAVWCSQPG